MLNVNWSGIYFWHSLSCTVYFVFHLHSGFRLQNLYCTCKSKECVYQRLTFPVWRWTLFNLLNVDGPNDFSFLTTKRLFGNNVNNFVIFVHKKIKKGYCCIVISIMICDELMILFPLRNKKTCEYITKKCQNTTKLTHPLIELVDATYKIFIRW